MIPEHSYYAEARTRKISAIKVKSSKKSILAVLLVASILILSSLALVVAIILPQDSDDSEAAKNSTYWTVGAIPLLHQHKDTAMWCTIETAMPPTPAHVWNHAKGVDGIYGSPDDCPHCSVYCAPASIAMISTFRGAPPPINQQDDIYDAGKIIGEVAMGDLIINTEGLGMFDGTGVTPPEVQTSFMFAVGPFIQHDWWGMGNLPLNASQLQHYINTSHPVLWLDHWGYPVNQSLLMPGSGERPIQGHAKVIGGFDDSNTAGVRSDDLVLIYDPWPEYTDLGILPVNASKGPGGTFDPYWLPLNDVNLSNISDIFLVDMFPDQPAVPEFTVLIIPILGVMAIALTASRWRSRNRET